MYVELKMEGNVFTSFGGLSGHSSTETRKYLKIQLIMKISRKQKEK